MKELDPLRSAEQTGGGILYQRKDTPQRLIRELLEAGSDKCIVCGRVATRYAVLRLVWGDTSYFCDKHTFKDLPRYELAAAKYEDIPSSHLVRRALKWLEENKIEEKT